MLRLVHGLQQVLPAVPLHLVRLEAELLDDVGVEALLVEHGRDVVDRRHVHRVDHGALIDVAHQGDLALVRLGDDPIAAEHQRIRLDADGPQRGDRVLRGLGLLLPRGAHVGNQRHVDEEHVAASELVAHLASGLDERLGLDVADRAADLGDDHVGRRRTVGRGLCLQPHPALDLVGDVRDDLHRVAQVLAATLALDDARIDLAGRHVGRLVEVDVEEALVVADVEVGLGTVIGDENFAVLERVHRAGVNIQIRVEFLHHNAEPTRRQKVAQARGREAFPEGRDDAPGDEDVLGNDSSRNDHHGVSDYPNSTHARRAARRHGSGCALVSSSRAWTSAASESGEPLSSRAISAVRSSPSTNRTLEAVTDPSLPFSTTR